MSTGQSGRKRYKTNFDITCASDVVDFLPMHHGLNRLGIHSVTLTEAK